MEIKLFDTKDETILRYYLDRARALRMLYYKTGNKKYEKAAMRVAKEGKKELEKENTYAN